MASLADDADRPGPTETNPEHRVAGFHPRPHIADLLHAEVPPAAPGDAQRQPAQACAAPPGVMPHGHTRTVFDAAAVIVPFAGLAEWLSPIVSTVASSLSAVYLCIAIYDRLRRRRGEK